MTSPELDPIGLDPIGLDPDWIGSVVSRGERSPTSVEFTGFVGTGQMSRNARFTIGWADGGGPSSVMVKVPSSEASTRAVSFEYEFYRKECEFYRSVGALVDVSAPASLAVHFDASGQDFAIVLEDLVGCEQGDQFTELTERQLVLAIEQAAALHAPVWGHTDGPVFSVYREGVSEQGLDLSQIVPALLPTVFDRLGAGLEADVSAMLERFAGLVGDWQEMGVEKATLVHSDFRPDNFMFGIEAGAPPITVLDWQTLMIGSGATDVAYLLGAAVGPPRRREIEHDLLGRYLDELGRRGVDYPMEQCLVEYAMGTLHGVVIAVLGTSMADQTKRGDAMFTLMLNRHGRHALDLDVLDRVEAGL